MANAEFILACAAPERAECLALGYTAAHFGFRIAANGRLLRTFAGRIPPGGILVLSDDGSGIPDEPIFMQMLDAELSRGRYRGILIDFDAPGERLTRLVRSIGALCARKNREIYVPEPFSPWAENAFVLTGSDVAAGSFAVRMEEIVLRWGAHAAVELVPMCVDFPLPSHGVGRPMTAAELDRLLARGIESFYSAELCLRYFTYADGAGVTHFVAYDDARSLREKIRIAGDAGVERIFGVYAELREMLADILPETCAY